MELNLTEFVLGILIAAGLLVALSAVAYGRWQRSTDNRALATTIICRLCLHAFHYHSPEKILPCPQCGARNEAK